MAAPYHPPGHKGPPPGYKSGFTYPFVSGAVEEPPADEGIDFRMSPGDPIVALAHSKLLGIYPDWYAGQPIMVFQFLDQYPVGGSDYWYIAEQITPQPGLKAGDTVAGGQTIGHYARSGTGIEIGYASPSSSWPEETLAQAHGHGSMRPSPEGTAFMDFLNALRNRQGISSNTAPGATIGAGISGLVSDITSLPGEIAAAVVNAIWSAISGTIEKAALYALFVVVAVWLISRGIRREVGVDPLAGAARAARTAATVGAAAA